MLGGIVRVRPHVGGCAILCRRRHHEFDEPLVAAGRVQAYQGKRFGRGIGVAGLLTGNDFIAALKGKVYGDFVVLPSESMVGDVCLFLDDLTIKDVERELGVEVVPSGYDARDFVREMRSDHPGCGR